MAQFTNRNACKSCLHLAGFSDQKLYGRQTFGECNAKPCGWSLRYRFSGPLNEISFKLTPEHLNEIRVKHSPHSFRNSLNETRGLMSRAESEQSIFRCKGSLGRQVAPQWGVPVRDTFVSGRVMKLIETNVAPIAS